MKKQILVACCALALSAGSLAANAQVVVRIGPPPPIVERRPPPPHRGVVWIHGYHRWDGNAYVWVPGEYRDPPHRGAVWVDGRWGHGRDGYRWSEGHWR
jgi:hypothetical protein